MKSNTEIEAEFRSEECRISPSSPFEIASLVENRYPGPHIHHGHVTVINIIKQLCAPPLRSRAPAKKKAAAPIELCGGPSAHRTKKSVPKCQAVFLRDADSLGDDEKRILFFFPLAGIRIFPALFLLESGWCLGVHREMKFRI
ncbi:hypothetical protein CEXT_48271 [Caerostris extrusa]|uniref:Uncharacterized protein n=1 Tax=Caerostris extrusa TaxID=172846 RepID=A0AAV4N0K1_CAEEX|nr:hypothetical protein CEXT_48271 [Caerostris extrusa]